MDNPTESDGKRNCLICDPVQSTQEWDIVLSFCVESWENKADSHKSHDMCYVLRIHTNMFSPYCRIKEETRKTKTYLLYFMLLIVYLLLLLDFGAAFFNMIVAFSIGMA